MKNQLLLLFLLVSTSVFSQVAVNNDGSTADSTAALDIKSTTKGLLVPRMTTAQRTTIATPATGLLVFDNITNSFWFYNGTAWVDLSSSTGGSTQITDADNDTKIQVEESADEDVIRFDIGGTEFFRMDSGRFEILNTGNSVFIGEDAGLNDDLTNNNNTFIGYGNGKLTSSGDYNTSVGYSALESNQTGGWNTAIGANSMKNNNTSEFNSALGAFSLFDNTSGQFNNAFGFSALGNNTTGNSNVAMGNWSGFTNQTGSSNVLIGVNAGRGTGTHNKNNNVMVGNSAGKDNEGDGNIFIGHQSGKNETGSNKLYIENTNSSSPLIYGEFNTNLLRVNGTLNINNEFSFPTTDGTANQVLETDGSGNLTWQTNTGVVQTEITDADNDTKIQVEEGADEDIIRFDMAGTEFFRMDSGRFEILNTGGSVFIGEDAGLNDDLSNNQNTFVGTQTGENTTTGSANSAIGYQSLNTNTTGGSNTASGYQTLFSNTTGSKNIANGYQALKANTTGEGNAVNGYQIMLSNTTGTNNVASGTQALLFNTTGSLNTAIGAGALGGGNSVGNNNVALGALSGFSSLGDSNVYIGFQAGFNETGSNKLYIENTNSTTPLIYGEFDNDLLRVNGTLNINNEFSFPTTDGTANQILQTDGSGNLTWQDAVTDTLNLISDADNDTKIQVEATPDEDIIRFDLGGTEYFTMNNGRLNVLNTGNSVFIGERAGINDDLTGNRNIFIGHLAGDDNVSSTENVAIGFASFEKHTIGSFNTSMGSSSMQFHEVGFNNTAIGKNAMKKNIDGSRNTVIGSDAFGNATTGDENVVIGEGAMGNSIGVSGNVAIGRFAGANCLGENNIFLGLRAGENAANNNALYIANSNTTTPLIYGEFDNNLLRINGTLNINNAFSFPTTDGTANQVLKTDGSDNVSWADDTDEQTIDELALNGTTLEISLANDGEATKTVDLSSIGVPVGTIQMWPTTTPPAGWLICNGASYNATTYPDLFSVLGVATVPNFKGKFALGANFPVGSGGFAHQIGTTGGEEEVTLTVGEMPSHSHNITYKQSTKGGSNNTVSNLAGSGSASSTSNTGGNQAHNNMPPFFVINYIIKAQ